MALEDQLDEDQKLSVVKVNRINWTKTGMIIVIELHNDADIELVQGPLNSKNITHQLTNPETRVDSR